MKIDDAALAAIRERYGPTLDDLRRAYFAFVVEQHGGHVAKAAEELGVSCKTAYNYHNQGKLAVDQPREADG